ncbi:hypothetical protein [Burkholderia lata]
MRELAFGVRWIRLPVLLHIGVWVIADGNGWAIVDCGMFTAETVAAWESLLDTLSRRVPDSALVLPAHGLPFRGLHLRLAQLAAGHANGLQRLRGALAEPVRVVDLLGALFRCTLDGSAWQLRLASGECIAHLNRLIAQGEVEAARDAGGVDWYRLTDRSMRAGTRAG